MEYEVNIKYAYSDYFIILKQNEATLMYRWIIMEKNYVKVRNKRWFEKTEHAYDDAILYIEENLRVEAKS